VGVIDADFEDGLLICLDVLDGSTSLDEARGRIVYLVEAYREVEHSARVEVIREQLGIWCNIF